MNYQVPQFIEIEDKIFGPLSFRQFIYLTGGAALAYLFYTLQFLPFAIRLILMIAGAGLGAALAFYKVNERPLIVVIQAALKYALSNKLYLWKKDLPKPQPAVAKKESQTADAAIVVPKVSASKLKDLAWSLDIKEQVKEQ